MKQALIALFVLCGIFVSAQCPTLTVSGFPNTICAGAQATLTANGASSYTWLPGGLTSSVVIMTPTSSTNYTLQWSGGACSGSETVAITVTPNSSLTASASQGSICSGSTLSLMASGAQNYTWQPGNITSANYTFTPLSSAIYTLTGSTLNNCIASTTVAVQVIQSPVVTAQATPSVFCTGSLFTLTAQGAGSYTWTSSVLSTPVVTATSVQGIFSSGAGVSQVYTVTGLSGSCTNTAVVTVTLHPTALLSTSASHPTVCLGNSSTITASGAATYTWTSSEWSSPQYGNQVVVTPTALSLYMVAGTSSQGCPTSPTSVNRLIYIGNPNVVVYRFTPGTLCAGATETLMGAGWTGLTYSWNPPFSGTYYVVTPSVTTVYTVTGTTTLGCSSTITHTVTVSSYPTVSLSASSNTVCNGSSVTFTASGANTYTFLPGGNTGSVLTIIPPGTVTYSVTGANAANCKHTTTLNIGVVPTPTLIATSSASQVCAGNSAQLSVSGADSFTWTTLGGNVANAVTVSPITSTFYPVSGSYSLTGCTASSFVYVAVAPVPTITATSTSSAVCAGGSVTLSASGAVTYTWMPGALASAGASVTPASTTIYTVSGQLGQCIGIRTVNLVVNSLPVLTFPGGSQKSLCSRRPATLTVTGALTYTWLPVNSTGNSLSVVPVVSTAYSVIGADAAGCKGTANIQLIALTTPTVTPKDSLISICAGDAHTLSLTGSDNNVYMWNGTAGGSVQVVAPSANSNYTVTAKAANGCESDAAFIRLIVSPCTGIYHSDEPAITAYPNPAQNELTVQSGTLQEATATLLDQAGKEVLHVRFSEQAAIDVRSLPRGLYTLIIRTTSQSRYSKLILE